MPTDFNATYPELSTLRTTLSLGGPDGEFPGGGPIDMEALLAQAYRWKQRSADADAYRRGKEAQLSAERQAAALRLNAATEEQRADAAKRRAGNPLDDFWATKERLDEMNRSNAGFAHGAGLLGSNEQFLNLPAAGSITMGKDPFSSGFETYARLAGASPRLYETQMGEQGALQRAQLGEQGAMERARLGERGLAERQRRELEAGYGPRRG